MSRGEFTYCRRYLSVWTLLLLMTSMSASVTVANAASAIDIHGRAYFVVVEGEGDESFPLYVRFGQDGDRLYGTMIREQISDPFDFKFGLDEIPLRDGTVKGKKITLFFDGGRLEGKVKKGGAQIQATLIPDTGQTERFTLQAILDGDLFTGMYLGDADSDVARVRAGAAPDTMLVGLEPSGIMSIMFWLPVFEGFDDEFLNVFTEADFDPATGQFSQPFEEGIGLEGEIDGDGNMTVALMLQDPEGELNNGQLFEVTGTLRYFGDARKKPKLKTPKPKKIKSGTTTTVKIKHRFVVPGALVTEGTEGVAIVSYRVTSGALGRAAGGTIQVELLVDDAASGSQILLTVTNPDGQSGDAKKVIKVR